MLTTFLHIICVLFSFGLWAHAIFMLIRHFEKTDMPHPLLVVLFVSVCGLICYGLIVARALESPDFGDRTTSFVSLLVCNVLLWVMFHGTAALGKSNNWSFSKRASAFFFSAAVPMIGTFYLNVSRILFLLN